VQCAQRQRAGVSKHTRAQQRIAHRAEDHARHEQHRDGGGWHRIEASRPHERLANDATVGVPAGGAVADSFVFDPPATGLLGNRVATHVLRLL